MNGRYLRELRRRRADARGSRRSPAAAGSRDAVEISAGEDPDAGRLLAARRLPLRRAGRRPGGAREVARRGRGGPRSPTRARRCAALEPWDAERDRGGAARGRRAAGRQAEGRSSSRCASRSRARPSRRGSSRSLAVLGREESLRRIDAALASCRPSVHRCRYAAERCFSCDRGSNPRPPLPIGAAGPPDEPPHTTSERIAPRMMPPTGPASALRAADTATIRRRTPRPQRGPRPAPDGRLRGARGLPGAGRVARSRAAPRQQERIDTSEVVAAVESDVALVIAVLRLANQVEGKSRGRVESIVAAVEVLSPGGGAVDRRPRPHLRLLRALGHLGRRARALPPARRRHAARRRAPRRSRSATRTATA